MAAGLASGAAGLAVALTAQASGTGPGGPGLAWLMMGFVVPAAYLAGILGVTGVAARKLPGRVLARLPAALVTMHVSWGAGFLTSPRRLMPRNCKDPG
jgi:hypothetical protein